MSFRRHAASPARSVWAAQRLEALRVLPMIAALIAVLGAIVPLPGQAAVPHQAAAQASGGSKTVYLPIVTGRGSTSGGTSGSKSNGQAIQQAVFYDSPNNYSVKDVANRASMSIFTRGKAHYLEDLRDAGYDGLALQYFLSNEVKGPGYYPNKNSNCDSSFTPSVSNSVAIGKGEFCTYIHPNEDWFLHNSKGERLGGSSGSGANYHMNPASSGWRNFVRQRLVKDMFGDSTQRKVGYDGFFLDNFALRLYKLQEQLGNSDGTVKEFGSDAQYRDAVAGYLSYMREKLPNTPIWANVIDDWDVSTDDYLRTTANLSGLMNEAWGPYYQRFSFKPDYWRDHLTIADAALARGQGLLAVVQGSQSDTKRQQFGLASYLLITDNADAFFRYANYDNYGSWWNYDNYNIDLGTPKGKRYQAGATWRRDFSCGYVVADPTNMTGQIVRTCK